MYLRPGWRAWLGLPWDRGCVSDACLAVFSEAAPTLPWTTVLRASSELPRRPWVPCPWCVLVKGGGTLKAWGSAAAEEARASWALDDLISRRESDLARVPPGGVQEDPRGARATQIGNEWWRDGMGRGMSRAASALPDAPERWHVGPSQTRARTGIPFLAPPSPSPRYMPQVGYSPSTPSRDRAASGGC